MERNNRGNIFQPKTPRTDCIYAPRYFSNNIEELLRMIYSKALFSSKLV